MWCGVCGVCVCVWCVCVCGVCVVCVWWEGACCASGERLSGERLFRGETLRVPSHLQALYLRA